MYKLKNKTNSTQQIHFADGSCETVYPKGFVDQIDFDLIFKEEQERLRKFFEVEEVKAKPLPILIRSKRGGITTSEYDLNGGNK